MTAELAGIEECRSRALWCDGFIPDDYEFKLDRPIIRGSAWICPGSEQQEWRFTLVLDGAPSARRHIDWEALLPQEDATQWLFLDYEKRHIHLDPGAAVDDEPQRSCAMDRPKDEESALGAHPKSRTSGAIKSWGAKQAIMVVVVYFLIQLLIGVVYGIAAGVYLGFIRDLSDPAAISEAMAPYAILVGIFGMVVAGIIAFKMTRRALSGQIGRGALGPLGWRPSPASHIATAALTGSALSLVYLFILIPASPPTASQQWGPLVSLVELGGWPLIQWSILALVLAPPIEEFLFRGVLLSGLSNSFGIRTAAVIATVAFLMMHATEALGYWPAWVGIGTLSCAASLFRVKTDSLVPAVAVHAGYNLVIVIAAYSAFV